MFEFLSGIAVGVFLGWVILPEPAWVRDIWAKITNYWVRPPQ